MVKKQRGKRKITSTAITERKRKTKQKTGNKVGKEKGANITMSRKKYEAVRRKIWTDYFIDVLAAFCAMVTIITIAYFMTK